MSAPVTGAALIEAAQAGVSASVSAAEQLEMLPTGINPATAKGRGLAELIKRDRAGRPAGAQNKATREIKALCRQLFGDPMLEDFRLAAHTPESLAQYLGCSKLEAAHLLIDVRKDLRRYFYAPMVPVDEDGKPVPMLNLMIGGQAQGADGRPPWAYLDVSARPAKPQQNQGLSASPDGVSQEGVSQGEAK